MSRTSSSEVAGVAPARRSAFTPSPSGDQADPGTASTSRPSASAWSAVISAPERLVASITIVTLASAAIRRFRTGKRHGAGSTPSAPLRDDRAGLGDPAGQARCSGGGYTDRCRSRAPRPCGRPPPGRRRAPRRRCRARAPRSRRRRRCARPRASANANSSPGRFRGAPRRRRRPAPRRARRASERRARAASTGASRPADRARAASRRRPRDRADHPTTPPRGWNASASARSSCAICSRSARSAMVRATRSARTCARPLRPSRPAARSSRSLASGAMPARSSAASDWRAFAPDWPRPHLCGTRDDDAGPHRGRPLGSCLGACPTDRGPRSSRRGRSDRATGPRAARGSDRAARASRCTPAAPPHGQGFIAATSCAAAGKRARPEARTTTSSPSSSGWRSASSATRENSPSSSRKSTPRWARVSSPGVGPGPPPTSAAGGRAVVRCAERRAPREPAAPARPRRPPSGCG